MNSYKINYEQLRKQPEIKEILSTLQWGSKNLIYFYWVGAEDRDDCMTI